jgi:hypothetical protein
MMFYIHIFHKCFLLLLIKLSFKCWDPTYSLQIGA